MVLFLQHERNWLVGTLVPPDSCASELIVLRGFDAQVNGAMISVPAFRSQFG